jgi:hypothetical protein
MNGEGICTKNAQQKNVKAHFLKSIYINTRKNVQIGGGKGRVYIYIYIYIATPKRMCGLGGGGKERKIVMLADETVKLGGC